MDWAKLRTPDEKTPDGIVASTAVEQIRTSLDNKRPFFVAIGFRRPHSPYSVPAKYFDLYQPARIPLPSTSNDPQLPEAAWYELANQPALSEKEQREYIAAYYACNSFVDAQAGVVFSALDKLELWDRTVVVFFGDHGYHTGEHAMWHKMTLFEQSTRVPLIVHVPGVRGAGQRSRGLVELLDLYPTLAEACGLEAPPGLEGRSLTPLLHNPSRTGKEAVFSMVGRHQERNLSHKEPQYFGRSVRTVHWRYTEWDQGRRGVELYDLNADPRETRNLARSPGVAQVVSKMKALLQTGGRSTGS
jgi:iduronate 2-sulfatase